MPAPATTPIYQLPSNPRWADDMSYGFKPGDWKVEINPGQRGRTDIPYPRDAGQRSPSISPDVMALLNLIGSTVGGDQGGGGGGSPLNAGDRVRSGFAGFQKLGNLDEDIPPADPRDPYGGNINWNAPKKLPASDPNNPAVATGGQPANPNDQGTPPDALAATPPPGMGTAPFSGSTGVRPGMDWTNVVSNWLRPMPDLMGMGPSPQFQSENVGSGNVNYSGNISYNSSKGQWETYDPTVGTNGAFVPVDRGMQKIGSAGPDVEINPGGTTGPQHLGGDPTVETPTDQTGNVANDDSATPGGERTGGTGATPSGLLGMSTYNQQTFGGLRGVGYRGDSALDAATTTKAYDLAGGDPGRPNSMYDVPEEGRNKFIPATGYTGYISEEGIIARNPYQRPLPADPRGSGGSVSNGIPQNAAAAWIANQTGPPGISELVAWIKAGRPPNWWSNTLWKG